MGTCGTNELTTCFESKVNVHDLYVEARTTTSNVI